MKKLIKKADAAKICKANNFDVEATEEFAWCAEQFNKSGEAQAHFTESERRAIAIYFATQEIVKYGCGGECYEAYKVFREVDHKYHLPCGTTIMAIRNETGEADRWIIAELDCGQSCLTITKHNPYAKGAVLAS